MCFILTIIWITKEIDIGYRVHDLPFLVALISTDFFYFFALEYLQFWRTDLILNVPNNQIWGSKNTFSLFSF